MHCIIGILEIVTVVTIYPNKVASVYFFVGWLVCVHNNLKCG